MDYLRVAKVPIHPTILVLIAVTRGRLGFGPRRKAE